MRNIYRLALPVLYICLIAVSCSGVGKRARPKPPEDPRTAGEARFDPLGHAGDYDIITQDVPQAQDSNGADESLPPARQAPPMKHESQYFAVQVFASKSSSEAKDFQTSIEPLFEEEIKIDYQAPYYRVCVGKSAGYEEAEALLKRVNALGFPKAWLVKLKK